MNTVTHHHPSSLSIIIMAFNEAATLEPVVKELDEAARALNIRYEIIIVDDGSSDGTESVADRLSAGMASVRAVHHPQNRGIGEVLSTGIREAANDLVTFFPADGQCPAGILIQFVPLMRDHDVVLGYIPERKNAALAILLSKAERFLLRLLFGRMPKFQGIFMYRRAILADMPVVSQGRGWIIQMEWIIRAQQKGCRMVSVPTTMKERVSGQSKVTNFKSVVTNLRQVIVLFWHLQVERLSKKREASA